MTVEGLALFRKRALATWELNVHRAEPFSIEFDDLEEWLKQHRRHPILLRLTRQPLYRTEA